MKLKTLIVATSAVLFGLTSQAFAAPLKIGVVPGAYADSIAVAAKEAKAQGLDVQLVEFTDWTTPNVALNSGDIDANYFQHIPYLEDFNAQNGTHLVSAGAVHYEPMGLYVNPAKAITLDSIPDGATIAIPNEGSNSGRALILLQKAGLIELKDPKNALTTPKDIAKNPHNFKFKELESALLPRVLKEVDLDMINTNYAL